MEHSPIPTTLLELRAAMQQAGIKGNPILALPPLAYSQGRLSTSSHPLDENLKSVLPSLRTADCVSSFLLAIGGMLHTFLVYTCPGHGKVILRVDDSEQVTVCSEKGLLGAISAAMPASHAGSSAVVLSKTVTREDAQVLAVLFDLQESGSTAPTEEEIVAHLAGVDDGADRPGRLSVQMTTLLGGYSAISGQIHESLERMKTAGLADHQADGWRTVPTLSSVGAGEAGIMASWSRLSRGLLQTEDLFLVGAGAGCLAFKISAGDLKKVKIILYNRYSAADFISEWVDRSPPQTVSSPQTTSTGRVAASRWTARTKIALAIAVICLGIAACGCITTVISLLW